MRHRKIHIIIIVVFFLILHWLFDVVWRGQGNLVSYLPFLRMFQRYTLTPYYQDSKTKLVVVQKEYENSFDSNNQVSKTPFQNKNLLSDVRIIEGYKYQEMYERFQLQNQLKKNTDPIEIYKMENQFSIALTRFFESLFKLIQECAPRIASINDDQHYPSGEAVKFYYRRLKGIHEMTDEQIETLIHNNGRIPAYGGNMRENYLDELVRSHDMLSMYLSLSDQETLRLTSIHNLFIHEMKQFLAAGLSQYNRFNDYMKGDGIVYLGGGKDNQLVLLSLKILRDNGSKLPVEVIIPKREDYLAEFCQEVLASLNAKCKLMTDYIPVKVIEQLTSGQLKNVALLLCSFERVLYLDASVIPIKNPDNLFSNKPFINNHLVIWPDFWRRSTSPNYYKIASIPLNPRFKMRNSYPANDPRGKGRDANYFSLHDTKDTIPESSSASGQLLINKRIHFKTLLLAMYYNYYGNDFYYPLLGQGAAGDGEKETYIAAAHKLNLPYFQVSEFPREFGPINPGTNKREIFAVGQYDPIIDYLQQNEQEGATKRMNRKYQNEPPERYAKNEFDTSFDNYNYHLLKSSSLLFLNANDPKLYPGDIVKSNDGRNSFFGPSGTNKRLYGKDLMREFGGDFELKIMKSMRWCFCKQPFEVFAISNKDIICTLLDRQVSFLMDG